MSDLSVRAAAPIETAAKKEEVKGEREDNEALSLFPSPSDWGDDQERAVQTHKKEQKIIDDAAFKASKSTKMLPGWISPWMVFPFAFILLNCSIKTS